MKTCFEELRYAPINFAFGFLRMELDAAVDAYSSWQRKLLYRVKVDEISKPVAEAMLALAPLDREGNRCLFLPTQTGWTAYFDNSARGAEPEIRIRELAQQLKCTGVSVRVVPDLMDSKVRGRVNGVWGCVRLEIYGPEDHLGSNLVRSISVSHDANGWGFRGVGAVQEFEDGSAYARKSVRERFNRDLVSQYCTALGIDAFNETFYLQKGKIVSTRHWLFPAKPPVELSEAQEALGIRPG